MAKEDGTLVFRHHFKSNKNDSKSDEAIQSSLIDQQCQDSRFRYYLRRSNQDKNSTSLCYLNLSCLKNQPTNRSRPKSRIKWILSILLIVIVYPAFSMLGFSLKLKTSMDILASELLSSIKNDPENYDYLDNPDILPIYTPTHTACSNSDGIYHIAMGDIGGAAGTIFFQFVIGQILYAERYNLTPWVHLNTISHIVYDPLVHSYNSHNSTHPAAILPDMIVGYNASYDKPFGRLGHWRDARPGKPILWNNNQEVSDGTNQSTSYTHRKTLRFTSTNGIWNHYFLPVSPFVPGDVSCYGKKYVSLDLYLITPGIHGFSDEFATRCWRYPYLPDYVTKPHIPVTEWLQPQRKKANRVIRQYIRLRPYIYQAATKANPNCRQSNSAMTVTKAKKIGTVEPCLGLHIRHSDKAAGRRIVRVAEFLPYVESFLKTTASISPHGTMGHVYVATDSALVMKEIEATWPVYALERIRTLGPNVVRSHDETPVFNMSTDGKSVIGHHQTNIEILTEIVALSYCQFLVHGFSAVSESAIWMNYDGLHHTSVNLEDPDHLNASEQFTSLIVAALPRPNASLMKRTTSASSSNIHSVNNVTWPRPIQTEDIWPELHEQIQNPPTRQMLLSNFSPSSLVQTTTSNTSTTPNTTTLDFSCDGYSGVLHISSVGLHDSAGAAFFTSILNQLLYAEKYNLLPWIHLQSGPSSNRYLIYDEQVHHPGNKSLNNETEVKFYMMSGMAVTVQHTTIPSSNDITTKSSTVNTFMYPSSPAMRSSQLTLIQYSMNGTGIWDNYFEPTVHVFQPPRAINRFNATYSTSCSKLAMIHMEPILVSPGLDTYTPWAVRAWRYDGVPEHLWVQHSKNQSLKDWYKPMRDVAHAIVSKYYKFRPYIIHRAQQVNPRSWIDSTSSSILYNSQSCLGVHLRNSDKKGKFRDKIEAKFFLEYIDAYANAGGRIVYMATDSHRAYQYLVTALANRTSIELRSQGKYVVRSNKAYPPYFIERQHKHRVNSEVFVDIVALSYCDFLLHTYSTVAEAAIYLNPLLHKNSVNLEDPQKLNSKQFEDFVTFAMKEKRKNSLNET